MTSARKNVNGVLTPPAEFGNMAAFFETDRGSQVSVIYTVSNTPVYPASSLVPQQILVLRQNALCLGSTRRGFGYRLTLARERIPGEINGVRRVPLALCVGTCRRCHFYPWSVFSVAGWSSPVARQAHNLEDAGAKPAPATNFRFGGQPGGRNRQAGWVASSGPPRFPCVSTDQAERQWRKLAGGRRRGTAPTPRATGGFDFETVVLLAKSLSSDPEWEQLQAQQQAHLWKLVGQAC